jgi:hypothetical protein
LNNVAQQACGEGYSPYPHKIWCGSVSSFLIWNHREMSKHLNTHLGVSICKISHVCYNGCEDARLRDLSYWINVGSLVLLMLLICTFVDVQFIANFNHSGNGTKIK